MAGYARQPATRLGGKLGYLEARRADVERINEFTIKPNHVEGFYEIFFTGTAREQEIAVDVTFPVWFVDRPAFSFGGELMRDILEEGSFPTISAVVVGWTRVHELRPGGGLYTGARLAVVASGREGEQMILHWQMNGKALTHAGVGAQEV